MVSGLRDKVVPGNDKAMNSAFGRVLGDRNQKNDSMEERMTAESRTARRTPNERLGIEACLADPGLRNILLTDPIDEIRLSEIIDALHLHFHNPQEKADLIRKIKTIKWSDMLELENLLQRGDDGVHPLTG